MKCPKCGCFQTPSSYGKHVAKCRKKPDTQRSMTEMFSTPVCEETPRLQSKSYPIGGVVVQFPYKPYPVQFRYMSKVILALKNKHHALLESPTGTGKTLSLLCSVLSWQQKLIAEIEAEESVRCPLHDAPPCFNEGAENHAPNGSATSHKAHISPFKAGNLDSNTHSDFDDNEMREGRRFGSIAAVKIYNPAVKKRSNLDKKTRTVHVFVHDVYRNVKVKRITVKAQQTEEFISLVELEETSDRHIFVEIPKSSVAMVQRDLFKKPNAKLETWVLKKPDNYENPPSFIETSPKDTTKVNVSEHDSSVDKTIPEPPDEGDDDFVSLKNISGVVKNKLHEYDFEGDNTAKKEEEIKKETNKDGSILEPPCNCDKAREKRNPPKIFFCTRTHRQIAQIIRELNKTEFRKVRMSILSSREHSCINPKVENEANKNDKCRELCEKRACKYRSNIQPLTSPHSLQKNGINKAWDIEDLCKVGRKVVACPYYAAVEMLKSAQIVFAPYNYILDPFIVAQRELAMTDNVVIFDEGHNIEDVCRSSVGFEATQFQIGDCINNIEDVIKKDVECYKYNTEYTDLGYESHEKQLISVKNFYSKLLEWTLSFKGKLVDDYFEHSHYSLNGVYCLKQLQEIGITSDFVEQLSGWLNIVSCKDMDKAELSDANFSPPKPKTSTLTLCEKFIITYRIFAATGNASSFSACIKQSPLMVENPHTHKTTKMPGVSLSVTCLNPAVVFKVLSTKCHSVIVTSGTLSPMSTFQSELGAQFKVQHEGQHVVPRSNFLAVNLTAGLSGQSFNAGYKNAETFSFQDDVGQVISRVCSLVPHGVLVFFPSYRLLDKMCDRWRATGLWEKLHENKMVVTEPKGSNRNLFNQIMQEFDENVEKGALLLAVCRGKISEGVDFADNSARAVITIGIPFPNFKSIEVTDKRLYNDKFGKELGLLSGQEWYTIQAFRAVNQALGRCLRHINDWGAIIMIESRLANNDKYWKSISRWIRDDMIPMNNCNEALDRLGYFCHDKAGTLEQYESGQKTGLEVDITSPSSNDTFNIAKLSACSTPIAHNVSKKDFPDRNDQVVDLASSLAPKDIPLFSANTSLPQLKTPAQLRLGLYHKTPTAPKEETADSTDSLEETTDHPEELSVSSSPDLFEDETENEEQDEITLRVTESKIAERVTISSPDEKRSHSPDDTSNLVVKRRKVSRIQQMLNQSATSDVTSSDYCPSPTSSSSDNPASPSSQCQRCAHKLLRVKPPSDKIVKIIDFIRGTYDIKMLGKILFVPFSNEGSKNSTLGNMGVFCAKCGFSVGRLTFSIDENIVIGIVKLE